MTRSTLVAPLAEDALPAGTAGVLDNDTVVHIATYPLRPCHASVKVARDFAWLTLQDWNLEELFGDVAVVVSELVTNALRHGLLLDTACLPHLPINPPAAWDPRWPVELSLLTDETHLLCAVNDPNNDIPVRRRPDPTARSGRGLHLVESLTLGWGCTGVVKEGAPSGKTVWALFPLPSRERPPAAAPVGPTAGVNRAIRITGPSDAASGVPAFAGIPPFDRRPRARRPAH